jgi:hypothetical protein
LNSPLSFDLAVVSIEVEIAMLLLNILLSPHFSSAQRTLRPYRHFCTTNPEENKVKTNAPDRTFDDMFMHDYSLNLLALKTKPL